MARYARRERFGELEPANLMRPRQLEHEIPKLKKRVAERDLELQVMRQVAENNR